MSRQNYRWSLCSADSLTLKAGWQCPASEEVLLVCRERRWLCPQRLRHCGERKRERERGLMRWQDMYLNLKTDQINKYITIYVRRTCIHRVAILYIYPVSICVCCLWTTGLFGVLLKIRCSVARWLLGCARCLSLWCRLLGG